MRHLAFIQEMHSALDQADLSPQKWEIRSLQAVGSTNTRVGDMLGLYDKVIVLSETQSRGRGRGDNIWYSPRGGLWLSLGFMCDAEPKELSSPVIQRIHKILSEFVDCDVKEPNDILIEGKKVCGILVETKVKSQRLSQVIIGVGINIENEIPEEVEDIATRLSDHTEELPPIHTLASRITIELIDELQDVIPLS